MGRLNKRDRYGGHFNMCAETKLKTLEGDESDRCSKKTPLFVTCLVMYSILEGLIFRIVCNTVLRCSKHSV